MPILAGIDNCCGCSSCENKCPKGAINMLPNVEGFLHPVVDTTKCIECGLCESACPGLAPVSRESNEPFAVIVKHKDDVVRYQSTSGGSFTAIAEEIIKRGGIVYGAIMTPEFMVHHTSAETIEELAKFRNSKYVQSKIGNCYKEAKKYLIEGRWVCFSGTPCQINGLYKFLGKDYDNLIAVDVVCKSVPSPMIFQKYIEFKTEREGKISDVVFRDKKRGFQYCTMAHYATYENRLMAKSLYRRGSESDEWLRLFLSGKISRRSCMTCKYQSMIRPGDFTLGDIWETGNPNFDDNKGCTLVHVWTTKGKVFLDSIRDNVYTMQYPIKLSRGTERKHTLQVSSEREQLFSDANNLPVETFFKKYAPMTLKVRMKQFGRVFLWKMHLHNMIRGVKHFIIHR